MKPKYPGISFIFFPVVFFLLLAQCTQQAWAVEFSEFGLLTFSAPGMQSNQNSTLQSSPGFSGGGGISLGFRFFSQFEAEVGLLYFGQSFSTATALTANTQYNLSTAQVPLIFRYLLNEKLSAGAGIYWSHGAGNISVTQNNVQQLQSYQDLAWAPDDTGLCASLRYRSPLTELISLNIDLRGLFGLSNMDISGNGVFQTHSIQLLAGVSLIL